MSMLSSVRRALEGNESIVVVGVREENHLPMSSGSFVHTADFHVAPKMGIYTAEGLQAFMVALVPGVVPTRQNDFQEWKEELKFGVLFFDEEIGEERVRRELVLTDEDMFSTKGFVDGEMLIQQKKKLWRRTWVHVYPNVQIAEWAFIGEDRFQISRYKLKNYQDAPLSIVCSKM